MKKRAERLNPGDDIRISSGVYTVLGITRETDLIEVQASKVTSDAVTALYFTPRERVKVV